MVVLAHPGALRTVRSSPEVVERSVVERRPEAGELMPVRGTKLNQKIMAQLPPSWRAIADGSRPLEELSDDEVFKGRIKRADGVLGPRPSFYPQNFIDEQIRRSLDWANDEIRSGARDAIATLKEIMTNPEVSPADRIKAAMFFTDRFLGKEISRVLITAEDPVESLFRQILADPEGLSGGPVPKELSAAEREMLS